MFDKQEYKKNKRYTTIMNNWYALLERPIACEKREVKIGLIHTNIIGIIYCLSNNTTKNGKYNEWATITDQSIAAVLHQSTRHIQKSIKDLEEIGIVVRQQYNDNGRKRRRIKLNIELLDSICDKIIEEMEKEMENEIEFDEDELSETNKDNSDISEEVNITYDGLDEDGW